MGLDFSNPLGLAAGFDRTGCLLPTLASLGFGHVEVGTITRGTTGVRLATARRPRFRVGVNIGSARRGLDEKVIDDYVAAFERVCDQADYVSVNLSSPFLGRSGDTPGVDSLVGRLSEVWGVHCAETGRGLPLLIKVACGAPGMPLPAAITAVRRHKLSGVVLVSSSLAQIATVCTYLEGAAVISVGGVASGADIAARLAVGAGLVQIHSALVRDGPAGPKRILAALQVAQ
ncbi:MAG: dihydroorotate oxidase [Hyphomicrobium sp.]|jgi:dihydroorotate dehydrogenase